MTTTAQRRTDGATRAVSRGFDRVLTVVENSLLVIAGVIVVVMMAVITISALGRYVFSNPVSGVEAMVELFLAPAATYFAISSALRHRQHVGVTILVVRLPRVVRRYSQIIVTVLLALTFAVIAYQGLLRTTDAFSAGRVDDATGLPLWLAYASVPLGCAVFSLRSLQIGFDWWTSGAWRIAVALPDRADEALMHPSA